jgi:hypothetical protein
MRGPLLVGGGLALETRLVGFSLLRGRQCSRRKLLGLPKSRCGQVFGTLLGGLTADGLLLGGGALGGFVLLGALALDSALGHVGSVLRRFLLGGGLVGGLAKILSGLGPLGVRDGLVGDGGLAILRLGLLELSLLDELVLAGHGPGDFLGLARDAVEQALTGLRCCVCVVLAHM